MPGKIVALDENGAVFGNAHIPAHKPNLGNNEPGFLYKGEDLIPKGG